MHVRGSSDRLVFGRVRCSGFYTLCRHYFESNIEVKEARIMPD